MSCRSSHAARATPRVTSRHMETCFPASSFLCPAAMCADKSSSTSGAIPSSSTRCVPSLRAICQYARDAATSAPAPVVPAWLTWKEICAAPPLRTAKNPSPGRGYHPPICTSKNLIRHLLAWFRSCRYIFLRQLRQRPFSACHPFRLNREKCESHGKSLQRIWSSMPVMRRLQLEGVHGSNHLPVLPNCLCRQ